MSVRNIFSPIGLKEMASEMLDIPVAGRTCHFLHNWKSLTQDPWVLRAVEGVKIDSPPGKETTTSSPLSHRDGTGKGGNRADAQQRSNSQAQCQGGPERLLLNHIPGPQKGRSYETCHKPESTESVCGSPTLQVGGHAEHEGPAEAKRLDGQGGSERCLLYNPDTPRPPATPEVCGGEAELPIHLSTLRPVSAPWIFTNILKPVAALLREHGVRLVIYIDDILIMAEIKQLAEKQTVMLVFLLKNLGFLLSQKSVYDPAQTMEFLGMVVDSLAMKLKVPGEKFKKLRQSVRGLLNQVSERNVSLGREDDCHVTRNPTSTTVLQVPTERPHQSTGQGSSIIRGPVPTITRGQGRAPMVDQLPGAMEWQSLLTHEPEVVIESDASLTSWGAACQEARTGGPWSPEETQFHINCLEILAAFLATRTFMKDKRDTSVLLLIDNTTAVAYINHQGGTVSSMETEIAKDLWHSCQPSRDALDSPGI